MARLVKPKMLKEPKQPKKSADDATWERHLAKLKTVQETNANRLATYETRLKKREKIQKEVANRKMGKKSK